MKTFLIILAVIVVLGMAGFIFISKSTHSQTISSNTSASITPDMPVKDFAPNIPMDQKTTIIVQNSDSSMEKYLVPKGQEQTYIKSLPPGYHVVK